MRCNTRNKCLIKMQLYRAQTNRFFDCSRVLTIVELFAEGQNFRQNKIDGLDFRIFLQKSFHSIAHCFLLPSCIMIGPQESRKLTLVRIKLFKNELRPYLSMIICIILHIFEENSSPGYFKDFE